MSKFISIEGIEGVGKSTIVKFIQDYLSGYHIDYISTREPGGTKIAEQIRKILLMPTTDEVLVDETELLLMFACRAQHIANVILPALQAGKWVVSDRFVDATYAYQGGGRRMDLNHIEKLDKLIVQNHYPDLTILLDAPPEVGLARTKKRGNHDRIEQEHVDFFQRVRNQYLLRANEFSQRFRLVNADQPLEKVQLDIKNILNDFIGMH